MNQFDLIVIGAGVVGTSIARIFAPDHSVLVLERHETAGSETSRLNSGVIHSGIHLPPTYLKARLARRGSQLIRQFCLEHELPYRQVGMHVVVAAQDVAGLWAEVTNFGRLVRRARRQSIPIRIASRSSIAKSEPSVNGLFGIWIPQVAIISPEALVNALVLEARNAGADFFFTETVTGFARHAGSAGVRVFTDRGEYQARLVINAAGLGASEVAALGGYRHDQYYYRGEYYEILPASGLRVSSLVYPVFRRGAPGLGIHLTPTIDGRLLVGPNARRVERNTDYDWDRTPPETFFAAVKPFLPALDLSHLRYAFAGIRPKLSQERQENDFRVRIEPDGQFVNLIGIESPGLTASLAIAEYVKANLQRSSFLKTPLCP